MTRLSEVVRLERQHQRTGFDCGAAELNKYIAEFAWQNQRANNATTFVALDESSDPPAVVAYYSITVGGLGQDEVPLSISKGSPRQMGVLLLARFAVATRLQGRGVGSSLLVDALRRTLQVADTVGVKALLIHCRDDAAKAFYLAKADFLESPSDSMHLLLEVKEIRKLLV